MAFLDSSLNLSNAQAITTTAASTSIYDITSAGAGNAPAMLGANGVNTAIGGDIFAGDGQAVPIVQINVNTTGTTSNTLTISLQAAPDDGAYSPGTYYTISELAAAAGTTFVANQVYFLAGAPIPPGKALPRFYRLLYTCSGALTVTLTANITLNPGTVRDATLYGSNFTVANV